MSKSVNVKAKAKPKRHIITELLVWEGTTIRVKYESHWLSLPETETAHIELDVMDPEGAPLPVTDTGYRSHFLRCSVAENAGGPAAYVKAWLDAEARSAVWQRRINSWRQLSLF
jgi:hypothetical protein